MIVSDTVLLAASQTAHNIYLSGLFDWKYGVGLANCTFIEPILYLSCAMEIFSCCVGICIFYLADKMSLSHRRIRFLLMLMTFSTIIADCCLNATIINDDGRSRNSSMIAYLIPWLLYWLILVKADQEDQIFPLHKWFRARGISIVQQYTSPEASRYPVHQNTRSANFASIVPSFESNDQAPQIIIPIDKAAEKDNPSPPSLKTVPSETADQVVPSGNH